MPSSTSYKRDGERGAQNFANQRRRRVRRPCQGRYRAFAASAYSEASIGTGTSRGLSFAAEACLVGRFVSNEIYLQMAGRSSRRGLFARPPRCPFFAPACLFVFCLQIHPTRSRPSPSHLCHRRPRARLTRGFARELSRPTLGHDHGLHPSCSQATILRVLLCVHVLAYRNVRRRSFRHRSRQKGGQESRSQTRRNIFSKQSGTSPCHAICKLRSTALMTR